MKQRVYIFLLVLFLLTQMNSQISSTLGTMEIETSSPLVQDFDYFIEHEPLLIESNQDLEDFSTSGAGLEEDPYIIEKLSIIATGYMNTSVEIRGTTAYFVIRNCYMVSDYIGILVDDVYEGRAAIINNTCVSSSGDGGGIGISSSNNCTITENRCSNFMQGIHLNLASRCYIANNNITDNNYQGINIRFSNWNIITGNIVNNSTEHGLALVRSSSNNVVHHNSFIDNGNVESYHVDGGREGLLTSQGFDEGTNNIWYDITTEVGNWWSDYSGSGSYLIDGLSDALDPYPNVDQDQPELPGVDIVQFSVVVVVVGCLVIVLVWRFLRKQL